MRNVLYGMHFILINEVKIELKPGPQRLNSEIWRDEDTTVMGPMARAAQIVLPLTRAGGSTISPVHPV
jgi:hypothetical protein